MSCSILFGAFCLTRLLSPSDWMQLPNYNISEWSRKLKHKDVALNNRVALSNIAEYYQDYVTRQNLDQFFINNCQVKKVTFCEKMNIWCVYCKNEITKEKMIFTCNHIVLATGNSDRPNKLNVFGENLWFVRHYLNDLEDLLKEDKLSEEKDPILVIGKWVWFVKPLFNFSRLTICLPLFQNRSRLERR